MKYRVDRADGLFLETPSRESAIIFADQAARRDVPFEWIETPPRFRIKKATWATATPWILYDRTRPAFRSHSRTHARAVHAMRNIVRREHGFGPLLEWPAADK